MKVFTMGMLITLVLVACAALETPLSTSPLPLPEGEPHPVVLRIRRTGGIAGFDHELTVTGDGTASFVDRRTFQRAHFQMDLTEVQRALEGLRPFVEVREVGAPIPDGFVYTVAWREAGKAQTVTFYEGRLSEKAASALQPIRDWFRRGQDQLSSGANQPSAGPAEAARRALAEKLGLQIEDVKVVSTEAVDWPDTSLGCPEPEMMYAQVITPGHRVVLEAKGQRYEAHTDWAGKRVVFCTAP